jgi:hypothetical protein
MRPIRNEEIILIHFLLQKLNLAKEDHTLPELVDEYEGGVMGSIGLGKEGAEYAGDLIQAEYVDTDNIQVVITLTQDQGGQLLDLDFWKVDFSKLIRYPKPEDLILGQ